MKIRKTKEREKRERERRVDINEESHARSYLPKKEKKLRKTRREGK